MSHRYCLCIAVYINLNQFETLRIVPWLVSGRFSLLNFAKLQSFSAVPKSASPKICMQTRCALRIRNSNYMFIRLPPISILKVRIFLGTWIRDALRSFPPEMLSWALHPTMAPLCAKLYHVVNCFCIIMIASSMWPVSEAAVSPVGMSLFDVLYPLYALYWCSYHWSNS